MIGRSVILRIALALWVQVCCCQVKFILADSPRESATSCCGSCDDAQTPVDDSEPWHEESESAPCCPGSNGCGACCAKAPPPVLSLYIPVDTVGVIAWNTASPAAMFASAPAAPDAARVYQPPESPPGMPYALRLRATLGVFLI
ncbi:MAG: hypothetical protein EXS00_05200 [Phycisphaerales bacterium]|nr:hypothetical protein [Phycisphaerales bacterium]